MKEVIHLEYPDKHGVGQPKYTVILDDQPYKFYALRYGEEWIAGDMMGDNLKLAMFQRIVELEKQVKQLTDGIVNIAKEACKPPGVPW